jgi:hypothetical protein
METRRTKYDQFHRSASCKGAYEPLSTQDAKCVDAGDADEKQWKIIKPNEKTDAARSAENTETRMAKSTRSRTVIYVPGGHFNPAAARTSETIDGDGMREPE